MLLFLSSKIAKTHLHWFPTHVEVRGKAYSNSRREEEGLMERKRIKQKCCTRKLPVRKRKGWRRRRGRDIWKPPWWRVQELTHECRAADTEFKAVPEASNCLIAAAAPFPRGSSARDGAHGGHAAVRLHLAAVYEQSDAHRFHRFDRSSA